MTLRSLTREQWLNLVGASDEEYRDRMNSPMQFDELTIDGKKCLLEVHAANNAFSNFKRLYPDLQQTALKGLVNNVLTRPGMSVEIPGTPGKPSRLVVTRVERDGYDYGLLLSS